MSTRSDPALPSVVSAWRAAVSENGTPMVHDPDEPSDLSLYPSPSRVRRPKKWGLKYRRSKVLRSGVWLCTAVRDVAVPRKLSSTIPTIQLTSPAAEENPNWGFVLHPSLVAARSASRPSSRVVSTRTRLKTFNARSARSLSTTLAESYPSPWFTSRACRMTHGRVVTCRAFTSRARNPDASLPASNTLWLTTTIVSTAAGGVWADRGANSNAASPTRAPPAPRVPVRATALPVQITPLPRRRGCPTYARV